MASPAMSMDRTAITSRVLCVPGFRTGMKSPLLPGGKSRYV